MSEGATTTPKCANCTKTKQDSGIDLKRCAKCKTVPYCSRECQKADWKVHKRICTNKAASATPNDSQSTPPPSTSGTTSRLPKGLTTAIDMPFHRFDNQTWLHGRPEEDVYRLLIDAYRFRMEDNYVLEGDADNDSIYGGARDGRRGFRRFLSLAEKKKGLLPPWWSKEKAVTCERVGMKADWSSLSSAIEKSDVIERYGEALMPMQLRMLAEEVYGRGPGGQRGSEMRQLQMAVEKNELTTVHLDVSSMSR